MAIDGILKLSPKNYLPSQKGTPQIWHKYIPYPHMTPKVITESRTCCFHRMLTNTMFSNLEIKKFYSLGKSEVVPKIATTVA